MKGNAGTRSVDKTHLRERDVNNYIQAFTAKGGPDYSLFSKYDTQENKEKFYGWMEKQEKDSGSEIYRGAFMLTGDIENNIIFGGWVPNETVLSSDVMVDQRNNVINFTRDKSRAFTYHGYHPSPKSNYDRFGNEEIRVRYIVETKGKNFVDISAKSHYPEEHELVARLSTRFLYLGGVYNNGHWDIRLREI